MRLLAALAALLGLVLVACGSSSESSPSTSPAPSSRSSASPRSGSATAASEGGTLCGFRDSPPATYEHVILLIQENKSAKQIIASKDYPYLNQTLIQQCGLAKNYHSTSHPSLPNYLAMTSGTTTGKAKSSNCQPKDCPQTQDSIFAQVERSGKEWRQYAQGAAGNCDTAKTDAYEPEHAVPVYYTSIAARCKEWDVPLGTPDAGALRSDLDHGFLPAFAFISPDGDHEQGRTGDQWLNDWISRIAATADYQSGNTAIFVTWDEGAGSDEDNGETCADSTHADTSAYPSCWVPLVVISPSTKPAATSATYLNHYSLLATMEDLLGLTPQLGDAVGAPSLRSEFGF
jgi:phosphatidylinositol-3-phosphatase